MFCVLDDVSNQRRPTLPWKLGVREGVRWQRGREADLDCRCTAPSAVSDDVCPYFDVSIVLRLLVFVVVWTFFSFLF